MIEGKKELKTGRIRSAAMCLLLLSLLVLGLFSVKGDDPPLTSFKPRLVPRLIPEDEMPDYFLKHGRPPESIFTDEVEAIRWLEMVAKLGGELTGPEVPFCPTLVIGHGAGGDGYYWVWVLRDKVIEVDKDVIATIVGEINRVAGEIGFKREVPVKFAEATGLGGYDDQITETPIVP